MNVSIMHTTGTAVAAAGQTLRVAGLAAFRPASAHHAIPLPERRNAAATVASVNRGTP